MPLVLAISMVSAAFVMFMLETGVAQQEAEGDMQDV